MGSLAYDREIVLSDIYVALGIKESSKGIPSNPNVLSLLSSHLDRAIQKNGILIETMQIKDVITVFHGLRAPTLSIRQYMDRIYKYSCCSPSCFVIAQIYLEGFLKRTQVHLTLLNVHRLLITCVMVAAKFIDNGYYNNAYYAKVGGVSTKEMNRLEMKLLFGLDFRLHVTVETFEEYCFRLGKETVCGLDQIERPFQACRINESWPSKDDSSFAPTVAR